MQNGHRRPDRRRTDGDGNDAQRAAHRRIAEFAYQLFVDAGRDASRQLEYWRQAEQSILDARDLPPRDPV